MLSDLEYLPPIGASDHSCLFFKLMCYTLTRNSDEPRPDFYKGGYTSMKNSFSSTDWGSLESVDINKYGDGFFFAVYKR